MMFLLHWHELELESEENTVLLTGLTICTHNQWPGGWSVRGFRLHYRADKCPEKHWKRWDTYTDFEWCCSHSQAHLHPVPSERLERSFLWSCVRCLCYRPCMRSAKERWSGAAVPTVYWWHVVSITISSIRAFRKYMESLTRLGYPLHPRTRNRGRRWDIGVMVFGIIFGIVIQYPLKVFVKVFLSRLMFGVCLLWWGAWGCFMFFQWCIRLGGWWWFLTPLGPDSHRCKHST